MSQQKEVIIDSWSEVTKKYSHWIENSDGGYKVTHYYNPDGSLDEKRTYKREYYESLHKKEEKKDKPKKEKKAKKDYFGMSRWNPIFWILWIISLPFKIIWFILKLVGVAWLLSLFGIGSKD